MGNILFTDTSTQKYPVFQEFQQIYGDNLISICHLLMKFQINVIDVFEYKEKSKKQSEIEDINKQTFGVVIEKEEYDASSTNVIIIYNQPVIEEIGLSKEEQFAVIAHEIGHICFYFHSKKKELGENSQGEEIYSDDITCRLGLAQQLLSALQKLEESGLYTEPVRRFGMRKLWINAYLKENKQ